MLLVGLIALSACGETARDPMSSAVTYGNGRFIGVRWQWGEPGAPGWIAIETSVDGTTWREVSHLVAHGSGSADVVWTGDRFVALIVDFDSGLTSARESVLVSDDGERWTSLEGAPRGIREIASNGRQTFVIAERSIVELEGTTWSNPVGQFSGWSPQLAYAGDRFFVFGDGGEIADTVDGRAWRSASTGLTSIDSITEIDGEVVGFGSYDCCFGEVPEAIQEFRLRLVEDAWEIEELEVRSSLVAALDVGPRTVALHWDALSISDDGGVTWSPTREVDFWGRSQLATDGNGTVVAAGTEGGPLVSHDFGLSWDR